MYRAAGKRLFDLALGSGTLLLLAPLLGALALLVRIDLGRPILFRHVRPGLGGRPVTVLKFRTMTHATDESGRALPDDSQQAYADARSGSRITRLGSFLRAWSLDELPSLFNVIGGSMSLVGPRPLLTEYLDRYTPEQQRRHEVKPGITGWAQVHGRQDISYEERFAMDVWYVDHLSFGLDLRVLAMTVREVVMRRGTHETGLATGTEFVGTAKGDSHAS